MRTYRYIELLLLPHVFTSLYFDLLNKNFYFRNGIEVHGTCNFERASFAVTCNLRVEFEDNCLLEFGKHTFSYTNFYLSSQVCRCNFVDKTHYLSTLTIHHFFTRRCFFLMHHLVLIRRTICLHLSFIPSCEGTSFLCVIWYIRLWRKNIYIKIMFDIGVISLLYLFSFVICFKVFKWIILNLF